MPDRIIKFLNSLDEKTKNRLKGKLLEIKQNPFGHKDVKKLHGSWIGCYRFRLGKIRVIYVVKNGTVEVVDIDYRGNIY